MVELASWRAGGGGGGFFSALVFSFSFSFLTVLERPNPGKWNLLCLTGAGSSAGGDDGGGPGGGAYAFEFFRGAFLLNREGLSDLFGGELTEREREGAFPLGAGEAARPGFD